MYLLWGGRCCLIFSRISTAFCFLLSGEPFNIYIIKESSNSSSILLPAERVKKWEILKADSEELDCIARLQCSRHINIYANMISSNISMYSSRLGLGIKSSCSWFVSYQNEQRKGVIKEGTRMAFMLAQKL